MKISESYSLIQCYRVCKVINHEKADTIYPSSGIGVWFGPMIRDNPLHLPIIVLYEGADLNFHRLKLQNPWTTLAYLFCRLRRPGITQFVTRQSR